MTIPRRTAVCLPRWKSGNVEGLDIRVRKKGSESIDCVASADAISIHNAPCYLLVLMDITERKRSELELVSAIEEVMQDASWFSQTLIEKLANVKASTGPIRPDLTPAISRRASAMCWN